MITSIDISHYKSIMNARLRFGDKNIIVGANGSGKSNIVDAVYFLHDCARDGIDTAVAKRHGIDSIRQWSRTRPFNIAIEMNFSNEGGSGSYKLVLSSSSGNYRVIEESGEWKGPHPRDRFGRSEETKRGRSTFVRRDNQIFFSSSFDDDVRGPMKLGADDLFLTMMSGRIPFMVYNLFRPIADELLSFSSYSIYPNTLRRPQIVSNETMLLEDGGNLANVLKRCNSAQRFRGSKAQILAGLKSVMPIVVDFSVKSAGGFFVPVLRVEESNGDTHDFNLSQISDGTLRVLGLLTAFYQPNAPAKITVEEPEQMIHPGALPIISDAVNDFIGMKRPREDRQVFMTTHSPSLLDLFSPNDILWARFINGATECGKIRERQMDLIKESLFTPGEILMAEGFF